MQAICPKCESTYRVTQSMIDAHFGLLRCGNCSHQFNINEHAPDPTDNLKKQPPLQEKSYATPPQLNSSASLDDIELDADEVLKAHVRHLKALDDDELPKDYAIDKMDDVQKVEPRLFVSEPRKSDVESETIEDSLIKQAEDNAPKLSAISDPIRVDSFELNMESESAANFEFKDSRKDALFNFSNQTQSEPSSGEISSQDNVRIDPALKKETLGVPVISSPKVSAIENNNKGDSTKEPESFSVITPLSDEELQDEPHSTQSGWSVSRLMWPISAVLLLGILALQIKMDYVEAYQDDPVFRPMISQFCQLAGCELAPRLDLTQLEIVVSRLDRAPTPKNNMKISLYILNRADFTQPYPGVTLTLNDRAGKAVGRRTFNAKTFIDHAASNRLEPDKLGGITLDVLDPPEDAVGFEVVLVTP